MTHTARVVTVAALLLACGPTRDPPPTPVDAVLDGLHARGTTLKAFTAAVTMTDVDAMGASTTRDGHVWYQVKPDGSPRLHVVFDTRHFGKKPPTPDKKEYLLDDGWLTDRSYHDNNETRRQFARPGQKLNLFDLSTGPFPLPIGQETAAVHKAFDVKLVPPVTADPAGTTHLSLTPRAGTSLAKQFQAIDVWVDPAQQMPTRIRTLDKAGAQDRTTTFADLKVNPPLKDADFALPAQPGMVSHDEPMK